MNTLNIAQPLPRLPLHIPVAPKFATQRRGATDRCVSLHRYVQSELRRSDRRHTAAFAALWAAGFVTVVLAFIWPHLGGWH